MALLTLQVTAVKGFGFGPMMAMRLCAAACMADVESGLTACACVCTLQCVCIYC